MARALAAASDVGCALEVTGTLGRRGFSACAGLLVGLFISLFFSARQRLYDRC